MGFFSNIFDSIQNRIQEGQQRKKEEKEFLRRHQLEIETQRRDVFEEEFKKNARLVAIAQAKKDAAQKSGLQKLRAVNRARNLEHQSGEPGSFFDKMSQYTQRNLAKREENLKKTAEARNMAKKMREEKLAEQKKLRGERLTRHSEIKPFVRTYTQ